MRINPEDPAIILKVEIFGEIETRIIDMALDTGSTYSIIPWNIAEGLGYGPAVSRRKITLITASSVEEAPLIVVRAIKALGMEARNVDVVCHDLPLGSRVEGLLGLSFLKNFNMNLYFKQRGIELIDP